MAQPGSSLEPDVAQALPLAINSTCPQTDLDASGARNSFDALREKLEAGGSRQIILRKVPIYSDAALKSQLQEMTLAFQDRVKVLHWNQGPRKANFVKFDTKKGPRCGWIDSKALLSKERSKPLSVEDLQRAGLEGFYLQGKGSTLDAKVLVRNRFTQEDKEAGAAVYYHHSDPEPYDRLRIFNVLNIYDFVRVEDEVWYFVGGERASPGRQVEQMLYGWLKAKDAIPWPTRVNVYYRPGKRGLRIYGSETDALADHNPIAHQDADETEPKERNIPRFPLLDTQRPEEGLTLHKIAVPAILCVDREEHETCVKKIQENHRRARDIDILLVIEAGRTMRRYFDPVLVALWELLDELDGTGTEGIRFSIVLFGDFLERKQGPDTRFQLATVLPFSDGDFPREQDWSKEWKIFRDPMRDTPQAAFAALTKAIREADWRKGTAWHIVVWIGAAPNREESAQGRRTPAYDVTDVADALRMVDSLWWAVHVYDNTNQQLSWSFMSQANAIFNAVDGWGLEPIIADDPGANIESKRRFIETLKWGLFGFVRLSREIPQPTPAMIETSQGWERISRPWVLLSQPGMDESPILSDREPEETQGYHRLIVEGYVRQPEDDPNFRYWLAIKPTDMSEIVQSSQVFCDTLSDTLPELDDLVQAMVDMLRSIVGDVPRISDPEDETNIRRLLHKHLQVPIDQFSELLEKDLDGFVAWYKESPPEKTRAFKETACRKAALLELARNGVRLEQEQDDLVYDPTTRRWRPKPGTKQEFNWTWGTERGVHYYYIPLDYVF